MDHAQAAAFLLEARRSGPGPLWPAALRPRDAADAYAIQRLVMASLGEIGGWKVGAAGPEAPPSCAPMPASGLVRGPAVLDSAAFTTREIESEIGFFLSADLPPRRAPYERAEILAAIGSCHAGLEVLQSRFLAPASGSALDNLADFIRHGAYVIGDDVADWRAIDFAALVVEQSIDGAVMRRQGNPAGDMIRLVAWLADEGAAWAGGLRAGQFVTCGSWTGATPAPAGARVEAHFAGAGSARLRFA